MTAKVKPKPGRFWDVRLRPAVDKYAFLLACCLIAIGSLRIAATHGELSLTVDEPGHFACGLEYLAKHVYRYESQHPPLGRVLAALGPYLDGARPRGGPDRDPEGVDVTCTRRTRSAPSR